MLETSLFFSQLTYYSTYLYVRYYFPQLFRIPTSFHTLKPNPVQWKANQEKKEWNRDKKKNHEEVDENLKE